MPVGTFLEIGPLNIRLLPGMGKTCLLIDESKQLRRSFPPYFIGILLKKVPDLLVTSTIFSF
ncbi:hypothetical protein YERSI8AC_270015 [Enterobacterales bacterium 8AC]|nr:hypothetical protein YERSI8AC_270015 [Enterobacterales bacterium 8AC]